MNLHSNKELFDQAIIMSAEAMMISPAIIEKDYYVTYLLKELVLSEANIIFRGGTSLSKCHKLIKRFSEDIDLAFDNNGRKLSEAQRRTLTHGIIRRIEDSGFKLLNNDELKSRRNFNQYQVYFESMHSIPSLKPNLIVEMEVSIHAFPTELIEADSILYQYLKGENSSDIINRYHLEPFLVNTQSLERTYIDKVFALCDYYLASNLKEHSRHIYDLHKIYPFIKNNDSLVNLINEVRSIRLSNKMCLSAKAEVNVSEVIQEIIEKDIYKKDYNEITRDLLFEEVTYEEAIATLKNIALKEVF